MKIQIFLIMLVFMAFTVSAFVSEIEPVYINECVTIIQNDDQATSCLISSIYKPNGEFDNVQDSMTDEGNGFYSYEYCNNSVLGKYLVNGKCDYEGSAFTYSYNVRNQDYVDLDLFTGLILLALLIGAVILFVYGYTLLVGILLLVIGIVLLYSQFSPIISFLFIAGGVISIFGKR